MAFLALATTTTIADVSTSDSFAASAIDSKGSVKTHSLSPIYFDLILDEQINIDDPRLKSIIYVSSTNPGGVVKVVYTNSNAKDLSEKLANILSAKGVKVSQPQLIIPAVSDITVERFVTLWLILPKYNSVRTKGSQSSSKLVMGDK